ncbi:MAG: hypothetical protein AAGA77_08890 [Bacteroidota bacterium]
MTRLKLAIFCLAYLMLLPLHGQDDPFRGGFGDGYASDTQEDEYLAHSAGGFGSGYSSSSLFNENNSYCLGGFGDGYSQSLHINGFNAFCLGGIGDGYTLATKENEILNFSLGGIGDGYAKSVVADYESIFSKGGKADGFAITKIGHTVYWTGAIGTGWNVSGNWENGTIPTNCNPVIIPASVPNFPAVNAGVLRIGYHFNNGDYNCKKIRVNNGAELTTRVNCFVENYNLIQNFGQIFVKNSASNAFLNLAEGELIVKSGAQLFFEPN